MIDPETGDEISVSRPSKLGISLRRYWPAVAALSIVLALIGYVGSLLETKTYSATGEVFVIEPAGANTAVSDVQTIAALIQSDAVLGPVAAADGSNITSLQARVIATPANGANVIDIKARASTPRGTVALVRAVYSSYQKVVTQLPPGQSRSTYLAAPAAPASPSSPRPTRNAGIGFVLGFLVAVAAAWLAEIRLPTAADSDLVVRTLGAPMFADLTSGGRRHRRGRTRAAALTALSLDLDELAPKGTRVLCLCAARPDDIAADIAPGLAEAFAAGGWRIILVDGDARAALSRRFGAGGATGLSDVVGGGGDVISALVTAGRPGVQLLPFGRRGLDRAQPNLAAELRRVYDELTASSDLVLVVSPRVSLDTEARLIAGAATGTIVVVRGSTPLEAIEALRERLALFQATIIGFVRDDVRRSRMLRRGRRAKRVPAPEASPPIRLPAPTSTGAVPPVESAPVTGPPPNETVLPGS